MVKSRSGFTIVELLIVIVVISILATISVVAYSGIQSRARYSAASTDLHNLGKAMELFRAEHSTYPSTDRISTPATDLEAVLRQAGLYSATRANQTDWNNGIYPEKRFLFCTPGGDASRYAIVADIPLLRDPTQYATGATTLYIDHA